jgi:hypothetical protein
VSDTYRDVLEGENRVEGWNRALDCDIEYVSFGDDRNLLHETLEKYRDWNKSVRYLIHVDIFFFFSPKDLGRNIFVHANTFAG